MDKSIEERLSQLLPSSLSAQGQCRLEETIDQLAGIESTEGHSILANSFKSWVWKAAAAIVLLSGSLVMFMKSGKSPASEHHPFYMVDLSEMVVLQSSNRIDARESDGLILPADGHSPHYRYRYRVTDEELVRDVDTGILVTLRQPRYEILTVPVTQF